MPQTHHFLPADYGETLKAIQQRVTQERTRVILAANAALILLYWDIGRMIVDRQTREGWGAKIIDRLARDLRKSFPEMQGFSTRNLQFMRSFAEEFPDASIVKQLASQLPWGHVIRVMQRVKQPEAREWYMREAVRPISLGGAAVSDQTTARSQSATAAVQSTVNSRSQGDHAGG